MTFRLFMFRLSSPYNRQFSTGLVALDIGDKVNVKPARDRIPRTVAKIPAGFISGVALQVDGASTLGLL